MGLSTTYTKVETDYLLQQLESEFASGLKGTLKITDTAPTTQGLYILSDVGTYTNLGGLVTTAGKVNYAYFDGTTWSKVEVAFPNAVDNVTANGTAPVNSKAVIDYAEPKDYFPYKSKPISEIQQRAANAIKELYIFNYDSNYNYYLIEFALKFDATAYGWSNCENIVKVRRIHKTTGQSETWKIREPNCDPIDKLPTYLKFQDKFSVIVDWSKFTEGQQFDVDEAEAYLLSTDVGNINNAPLISQKNVVTETNGGKNVYYGNGVTSSGGEYNMSIGKEAMQSIVGGGYNLAIGYRAMKSHQTGAGNIAIGMDALLNSTGVIDVTVIGWEAGKSMVAGVGDTGMGRRSLQKSLYANANTAFGDSTLYSLLATQTNGVMGNVAMGYTAGEYCETIKNTILIGLACARNVKGGKGSVIIGAQAMLNRSKDSNNNVAIGENTMLSAGGNENVVIGSYTMSDNSGNENVVVGYSAGNSLTSGFRNVILGNTAQSGATNVSDSIVIGNNAKATQSNQVVIGTDTQTEFVICGVTFTKAQLQALKTLVTS